MCMLKSLSVGEILLPKSTNFRGLPFIEKMAPSNLKHMDSVLSEFSKRPIPSAAYSKSVVEYIVDILVLMNDFFVLVAYQLS